MRKDPSPLRQDSGVLQLASQACAVEDIVTQRERGRAAADECLANDEGFSEAARFILHGILE